MFTFTSDFTGERKLTIKTPVLKEETVKTNNSREFSISIIREKIRVLYICGQTNYEYSFLRNVLKGDPGIELVSFIILRNPENIAHQEIFMQQIHHFDLLIFENFAYQRFLITPGMLENVARFVKEKGGGFLMIGGDNAFGRGAYKTTAIEQILPIEIGDINEPVSEELFKLKIVVPQHPIVSLAADYNENKKLWDNMPSLEGCNIISKPKPGAVVIGVHPDITQPWGSLPVLAVWEYGNGRVMSMTNNTTWRWALGLAKEGKGKELYDRFWRQSVRWLTRGEQLSTIKVDKKKKEFNINDKIIVRITILDDQYRPDNSAKIKVVVILPSGDKVDISDTVILTKPGEYWVEFQPTLPGKFKFLVTAYNKRGLIGQAEASCFAKSFGEDENGVPNTELLTNIAYLTNGSMSTIKDFQAKNLRFLSPKSGGKIKFKWRIWTEWYFFVILITLLFFEWYLRRKKGLP